MIEEKKKEAIEKEAREILSKFSKTLSKVKFKAKEEKEGLSGFREEKEGDNADLEFRERMFANASSKDGDFIIAEKKKW